MGVKETLDRGMGWLMCDGWSSFLASGQQRGGENTAFYMSAVRTEACRLWRLLTAARCASPLLTAALKGEKNFRGVAQSVGLLPRSSGRSVQVSSIDKGMSLSCCSIAEKETL